MRTTVWFLMLFAILLAASCGSESERVDTQQTDADNTKQNAAENNPAAPTPLDQSESEADVAISANIRKAIVADDSLSVNAHNVKIITQDGMVTLKGPVRSEKDKQVVEAKAKEVVGEDKVTSKLEVKRGT